MLTSADCLFRMIDSFDNFIIVTAMGRGGRQVEEGDRWLQLR